jgi:hypothetical protein
MFDGEQSISTRSRPSPLSRTNARFVPVAGLQLAIVNGRFAAILLKNPMASRV